MKKLFILVALLALLCVASLSAQSITVNRVTVISTYCYNLNEAYYIADQRFPQEKYISWGNFIWYHTIDFIVRNYESKNKILYKIYVSYQNKEYFVYVLLDDDIWRGWTTILEQE